MSMAAAVVEALEGDSDVDTEDDVDTEEDEDDDMEEELRLRLLASGLEERDARLLVAAVDASERILEDLTSGTYALSKLALSCVGALGVLCGGALGTGLTLTAGVVIILAAAVIIWRDEHDLRWAKAVQADVRAILELTGNDDLLPLEDW